MSPERRAEIEKSAAVNAFYPWGVVADLLAEIDRLAAEVALVVELGGPERVRAGVELAEASDAYDGAWSWANIARRNVALARFREVGTR